MDKWQTYIDNILSIIEKQPTYLTNMYKSLAALVAVTLLWIVLKAILSVINKTCSKNDFIQSNKQIFKNIQRTISYLLLFVLVTYITRIFNIKTIETICHAILIILIATPLKNLILTVLHYFEERFANRTETKVDNILFDLLDKFAGVAIYLIAVVLALDTLGINVMPFVAGAGVLGVAVGFAAKDTLSNLIAGVLLIIDRPFEVGDRIEVWNAPLGSATWGDVIDIGLRATKIQTTDNIVIIIPNNEIMLRDIINYTIISDDIRVRVNIGVAYDADIDKAKEIICKVTKSLDWVIQDPAPKVVVRNFGESSVDLQLRVWIKDARKRMDTISYITDNVKSAFDEAGIEIPFPKRDITIVQKEAPVKNAEVLS